jgi:hypothetical protein
MSGDFFDGDYVAQYPDIDADTWFHRFTSRYYGNSCIMLPKTQARALLAEFPDDIEIVAPAKKDHYKTYNFYVKVPEWMFEAFKLWCNQTEDGKTGFAGLTPYEFIMKMKP